MLSPEQVDAPQASFVEMSPSNSSSGTYMWDEEGLEPLGGCGTHPLDSYDDSELNSMVSPIFQFGEIMHRHIFLFISPIIWSLQRQLSLAPLFPILENCPT